MKSIGGKLLSNGSYNGSARIRLAGASRLAVMLLAAVMPAMLQASAQSTSNGPPPAPSFRRADKNAAGTPAPASASASASAAGSASTSAAGSASASAAGSASAATSTSTGTAASAFASGERPTSKVKVRARVPQSGMTHDEGGAPAPRLEANVSKWGAGTAQTETTLKGGIARTAPLDRKPKPARVSADVYRMWVNKTHPAFELKASKLAPEAVLEIKGHWDKADRTMQNLGIPHKAISARQLSSTPLNGAAVVVVNCGGELPRSALQPLRDFVARGGYLLTTDWALSNMLKQTFPGFVDWNGGKSKGNVVDAAVVDFDPDVFKGTVTNTVWKLDVESHTVRVLNKSAVRVLARSNELARIDPDGQGILAVGFSFGRGKVLHLVGHFDNNSLPFFPRMLPDPDPVIGISLRQAMAANFVIEGVSRR